jgi:hypothetical protein
VCDVLGFVGKRNFFIGGLALVGIIVVWIVLFFLLCGTTCGGLFVAVAIVAADGVGETI